MFLSDREVRSLSPYLMIPQHNNFSSQTINGINLSSKCFPSAEVDISSTSTNYKRLIEFETEIDWSNPSIQKSILKLKNDCELW